MSTPNQPQLSHELSAQLQAGSLCITTEIQRTRYNGELPEIDRLQLQLTGTPEAFRFLATLLLELASNADASVILDPVDLKHLVLADWSAMEIACRYGPPESNTQLDQ
jgi:hypothetical protein